MVTLTKHEFRDENNTSYDIGVVTNYSLPSQNRIIVNQAAVGNGATVYFNGTIVKQIPITGRLFGDNFDDVDNKRLALEKLSDNGNLIEFITPYKPKGSNKFFISELNFEPASGSTNSLAFTATIIEYRQANVKTVATNLVNFTSKQAFLDVYNSRIGNQS